MAHKPLELDPTLKTWATEAQAKIIDAVIEHGGMRAAARALGVGYSTVNQAVSLVQRKAAAQLYAPEHHLKMPLAPGYEGGRGYSMLAKFQPDGSMDPKLVWLKATATDKKFQAMKEAALRAMCEELPRAKPVKRTIVGEALEHLVTAYTLTDCHVGMLAWGKEGGADWDLKIAEDTLVGCFEQMILAAPNSRVGFVNQLGDFLHFDGLKAITPEHGHLLDADGRFEKIVEVAVRILRRVIALALAKHERVVVLAGEGNHDPSASVWLRVLLAALYENEPRVEVIRSPLPYYVYEHGETMLGFHHGHLTKNDQLPILMAAQFPQVWGRTTKRYVHTGHRHHVEEKEHSGMIVVQHPTLAARDAYAARGGWHALRQVQAITYHKKFGRVRVDVSMPEMLEAA